MKKIKDALRVVTAHITKRYFPYYANLILNNSCNMKCAYCYKRFYSRKTAVMNTDEALTVVDNLAKAGTRQICILGGEPLLRDDLGRIVAAIKKRGIRCGINTNGILVKDKIALIKDLDYVHISLDGGKEANDLNRGRGTYDKIVEALEAVVNRTGTSLGIACTLTKNNLASIEELAHIAQRYKAPVSFFILMSQENEQGVMATSPLAPAWPEYLAAIDTIVRLKKSGLPIRSSYTLFDLTKKWPYQTRQDTVFGKPSFKWIRCYAGKFYCTIDTDSRIYPCPRLIGGVDALSSLEDGFQNAFQHAGKKNPCTACNIMCYNELNLSFGLNPETLARYAMKRGHTL
ncbi:MAG: radical SAM protein [Candidatus Omnitrophica bacterium]|nr:radical SAM protein [Candidatus Omnitrophota bacterium]